MTLVQGTTTATFDVLRQHFEASLANGDDVGASVAAVAYMINKMQIGLVGDTRGPIIALSAAAAAFS
jgi:hypothetical protein